MRCEIISLSIDGLFENFDYEIPFVKDINIITSPNGYGKSTILRFIYNFTNGNYHSFFAENFSELRFEVLCIPAPQKKSNTFYQRSFAFHREVANSDINFTKIIQLKKLNEIITITDLTNSRNKTIIIDLHAEETYSESLWKEFEIANPYIRRVNYETWENEYTGEVYNREKLIQICGGLKSVKENIANIEWAEEITTNLKSYYITTDRIKVSDYSEYDKSPTYKRRIRTVNKNMIQLLSYEIKERIQSGIRQQFEMSRRRESTFPQRLIKSLESDTNKVTVNDVMKSIKDIQAYEDRFSTLGILSDNTERTTEQLNQFFAYSNETGLAVLKTYLDDIKSKFKVLEGLASQLTLFKESVNSLLSFKELNISLEKGFEIKALSIYKNKTERKNIELSSLSSGEQHLIVMIGKLIFGASKGDLVLIDEPEISFHPEWQDIFITILNSIRNMKEFKVVMATHSPILIGGRWDNVIELAEQHNVQL